MSSTQLRIAVSLTAQDSVYQQAEAQAARKAAQKHGFSIDVTFAQSDAIVQSDHLLNLIHAPAEIRPGVIMLEPVGTGMVRVAREAARVGIGWIVLNREVDYLPELRATSRVPAFAVTTDHIETGRIQGRQLNALLPSGGSVVYLQGPSGHPVVEAREKGMLETRNERIRIRPLHGQWQESVALQVMTSWMRLPTWQEFRPQVVAAQNDFMAKGARKAFEQAANQPKFHGPAGVKYIGCDGMEEHGQRWVSEGLLDATIVCPSLTELALEKLATEIRSGVIADPLILAQPSSFPHLSQLRSIGTSAGAASNPG
jgi:ribose transport system substrate-binding protein